MRRNVADEARAAVAHRFEQRDRQPFERRRQQEGTGVAEQLFLQLAVYGAGEDDSVLGRGGDALQLLDVAVRGARSAGDNQLLVSRAALDEGLDGPLGALLGNEPPEEQIVLVRPEAQLAELVGADRRRRQRDAVRNVLDVVA